MKLNGVQDFSKCDKTQNTLKLKLFYTALAISRHKTKVKCLSLVYFDTFM